MWKVQLMWQLLNVVMLNHCRSKVAALDRHSTWIFQWASPRSCGFPGTLMSIMIASLRIQVQFLKQPSVTWPYSLITVPLTDNYLCLILQTRACQSFEERSPQLTHRSRGLNASLNLFFIHVLTCQFLFIIMTSNNSNAHSPVQLTLCLHFL